MLDFDSGSHTYTQEMFLISKSPTREWKELFMKNCRCTGLKTDITHSLFTGLKIKRLSGVTLGVLLILSELVSESLTTLQ